MNLKFKIFSFLTLKLFVVVNVLYLLRKESNTSLKYPNMHKFIFSSIHEKQLEKNSKWIVVSSAYGSNKVFEFLTQQQGFELLVVDTFLNETLNDKLWTYKTRFNENNGKNIGYLHAIENGATYIYDTDSEIKQFVNLNEAFSFDQEEYGLMLDCDAPAVVNPFAHFGQANCYPNGFPPKKENYSSIYVCGKRKTSLVQHGMINDDTCYQGRRLE